MTCGIKVLHVLLFPKQTVPIYEVDSSRILFVPGLKKSSGCRSPGTPQAPPLLCILILFSYKIIDCRITQQILPFMEWPSLGSDTYSQIPVYHRKKREKLVPCPIFDAWRLEAWSKIQFNPSYTWAFCPVTPLYLDLQIYMYLDFETQKLQKNAEMVPLKSFRHTTICLIE